MKAIRNRRSLARNFAVLWFFGNERRRASVGTTRMHSVLERSIMCDKSEEARDANEAYSI